MIYTLIVFVLLLTLTIESNYLGKLKILSLQNITSKSNILTIRHGLLIAFLLWLVYYLFQREIDSFFRKDTVEGFWRGPRNLMREHQQRWQREQAEKEKKLAIAAAPSLPTIENGDFSQPPITKNTYKYLTSDTTTVPGWNFSSVLLNQSGAWGFPMPYPNGEQCVSIQKTQELWTNDKMVFTPGITYSISFHACGRNCCDKSGLANPIDIGLEGKTFYSFTPPVSVWTKYSATFTSDSNVGQRISFKGTWTTSDRSSAIQGISLQIIDDPKVLEKKSPPPTATEPTQPVQATPATNAPIPAPIFATSPAPGTFGSGTLPVPSENAMLNTPAASGPDYDTTHGSMINHPELTKGLTTDKVTPKPIFYEPGTVKYNGLGYVPSYSEMVYLNNYPFESKPQELHEGNPHGFCNTKDNVLNNIEEKCNGLPTNVCSTTDCCTLIGGTKCVEGDENGPKNKVIYSDTSIKNRDVYYYKGECYGNCK